MSALLANNKFKLLIVLVYRCRSGQIINCDLCEIFLFDVSKFDIVENLFSHIYVVGNINNRIEMATVASFVKLPVHKFAQSNFL